MALAFLKKLRGKKRHLQLNMSAVPLIAGITCAIIGVIGLAGLGWFGYTKIYTPYIVNTVPEERITQKQEKLNVKDFETVSKKFEEKQSERAAAENPF